MADTLVTTPPVETPASPAATTPATPTPPATLSPAPAATAPDWRASFPDDLKTHKSLDKFKGPGELAKSYIEMEKYQGRSIAIPGPDSTPAERTAFYAKMGVPDTPEKYVITAPEGMGDLDAGAVSSWQQTFHRLNLTPEQVAGLTSEFFGSPMGNPAVASDAMRTATETSLKSEWGGAYAHNMRTAQEGVRLAERQTPGLLAFLESSGLGNHPLLIRHFSTFGRERAEAGDLPRDARSGDVMGPDGAKQKIAEIMKDRTHPYWKGDKAAVAEVQRLHELAAA